MSEEARKAAWEKWLNNPTGIGGFDAGWKAHAEHTAEIIKAAEALVAEVDRYLGFTAASTEQLAAKNELARKLTALKARL